MVKICCFPWIEYSLSKEVLYGTITTQKTIHSDTSQVASSADSKLSGILDPTHITTITTDPNSHGSIWVPHR